MRGRALATCRTFRAIRNARRAPTRTTQPRSPTSDRRARPGSASTGQERRPASDGRRRVDRRGASGAVRTALGSRQVGEQRPQVGPGLGREDRVAAARRTPRGRAGPRRSARPGPGGGVALGVTDPQIALRELPADELSAGQASCSGAAIRCGSFGLSVREQAVEPAPGVGEDLGCLGPLLVGAGHHDLPDRAHHLADRPASGRRCRGGRGFRPRLEGPPGGGQLLGVLLDVGTTGVGQRPGPAARRPREPSTRPSSSSCCTVG